MTTPLTEAQSRQQANRAPDGTYKEGLKSEPTATLTRTVTTGHGSVDEFDSRYSFTPIAGTVDDINHDDYESALAAADGNEKRVWTVTEGDYPEGEKIWKFDYDGDEVTVVADDYESALDQAEGEMNEHYGAGDEDEDEDEDKDKDNNPAVDRGVFDLDDGPYFGDEDDEDTWEPVSNLSIDAGNRYVNRLHWVVTDEEWSDEAESYNY